MLICAVGDLLLDVIVRLHGPLAPGDDVRARTRLAPGGQAANVASWVAELGGDARLVAARGDDENANWLAAEMVRRGVEVVGPVATGRSGVVVSLVSPEGERTMASDRATRLSSVATEWLEGADAVHVSGYALGVVGEVEAPLVTLDLSAVSIIDDDFRERAARLAPDIVFGTDAELEALGETAARVVRKRGKLGVVVDGQEHDAKPAQVVDTTGAGDAFAAGFLLGGTELGLAAAARCVSQAGAAA
jgi:sugar/nucleoside kinase (ribokinase family)